MKSATFDPNQYSPYPYGAYDFKVTGPNGTYLVELLANRCECKAWQNGHGEPCKHIRNIESICHAQIERNNQTTADGIYPEGDAIRARENERLEAALEKCYRAGVLARPMAKAVPADVPALRSTVDTPITAYYEVWGKTSMWGYWMRVAGGYTSVEAANKAIETTWSKNGKHTHVEVRPAKDWRRQAA